MPLQEIYYIAEMVVGVAVIISIVFVAIELRQNTYLTRKSMADDREHRVNWLMETITTDEHFREFFIRITDNYDKLTDKELFRATSLGIRLVRPMLQELVAYFDGKISQDEFQALKYNIERAKNRPFTQAGYEFSKGFFPEKVQKFWDSIEPHSQALKSTDWLPKAQLGQT